MFTFNEIKEMNKKLNLQYYKTKEVNKVSIMLVIIIKKYKEIYLVTDSYSYFYIKIELKPKDKLLNKSFMDFELDIISEFDNSFIESEDSEIILNEFVSSFILNTSDSDFICNNTISSLHYSDFEINNNRQYTNNKITKQKIELIIYHRYKITGIFNGDMFIVSEVDNVNYKELCNKIFNINILDELSNKYIN